MKTMKAIGMPLAGQQNSLELMEITVPKISEVEVLVELKTIGVGVHDRWFIPEDAIYPYAIGIEGAGFIHKVGSSVTDYKIGDRVMFTSSMQSKGGTWAEFSAVAEESLMLMPDKLDFVRAAAIPVAGAAALKGIYALNLKSGDTLFIAGASGAIGTLAIQLAKAMGYRTAASASIKNHPLLLSLGVDKAFDYQSPNWVEQVMSWIPEGVDAALAIQPETGITSMQVVKDGGKVVTISGDQFISERLIEIEQISHLTNIQSKLTRLISDVATDKIQVVVEQTFPFNKAIEALEKVETRHAKGKIILTM